MSNLKALSYELRKNVVDMIMEGNGGHIGGDMSVMDILVQLYFNDMNIGPDNMDDPDYNSGFSKQFPTRTIRFTTIYIFGFNYYFIPF